MDQIVLMREIPARFPGRNLHYWPLASAQEFEFLRPGGDVIFQVGYHTSQIAMQAPGKSLEHRLTAAEHAIGSCLYVAAKLEMIPDWKAVLELLKPWARLYDHHWQELELFTAVIRFCATAGVTVSECLGHSQLGWGSSCIREQLAWSNTGIDGHPAQTSNTGSKREALSRISAGAQKIKNCYQENPFAHAADALPEKFALFEAIRNLPPVDSRWTNVAKRERAEVDRRIKSYRRSLTAAAAAISHPKVGDMKFEYFDPNSKRILERGLKQTSKHMP
jgi:hypothetical protein